MYVYIYIHTYTHTHTIFILKICVGSFWNSHHLPTKSLSHASVTSQLPHLLHPLASAIVLFKWRRKF